MQQNSYQNQNNIVFSSKTTPALNESAQKSNQQQLNLNQNVYVSNSQFQVQKPSSFKFNEQENSFPEISTSNIQQQQMIFNIPQQKDLNINYIQQQVPFDYYQQQIPNYPIYQQQMQNNTNYQQFPFMQVNSQMAFPVQQNQNWKKNSLKSKNSLESNYQYFNYPNQMDKNQIRLLNNKQEDKNKQVVAVIVTISSCGSYDHLFTSVQQKSQQGTKVLVYEASSCYIDNLIKAYEGQPQDDVSKELMNHIKNLSSDCVVFNWECCGRYSNQQFTEGTQKVFKFLKIILDKGHMAMFSDFSLKALINQWNQHLLGPNPFIKTSQTSGQFQIRFKAGQLKQCPSAQLQIVGEMAEQGKCNIMAMGGTICFSVNPDNLNHQKYKLKVLSISTTTKPQNQKYHLKIDQFVGSAAHVLLTYPSGGIILTSMGHWIELMKIDTSQKKLFEVAEKQYGKQYACQMQNQYASVNMQQRREWVSKNAVNFIQNQAPCANMNIKSKKFY